MYIVFAIWWKVFNKRKQVGYWNKGLLSYLRFGSQARLRVSKSKKETLKAKVKTRWKIHVVRCNCKDAWIAWVHLVSPWASVIFVKAVWAFIALSWFFPAEEAEEPTSGIVTSLSLKILPKHWRVLSALCPSSLCWPCLSHYTV